MRGRLGRPSHRPEPDEDGEDSEQDYQEEANQYRGGVRSRGNRLRQRGEGELRWSRDKAYSRIAEPITTRAIPMTTDKITRVPWRSTFLAPAKARSTR